MCTLQNTKCAFIKHGKFTISCCKGCNRPLQAIKARRFRLRAPPLSKNWVINHLRPICIDNLPGNRRLRQVVHQLRQVRRQLRQAMHQLQAATIWLALMWR